MSADVITCATLCVSAVFAVIQCPSVVLSSAGAQNTPGWEVLAIFDCNRRLSRKRCELGPWLPWNVNRKSWVADRSSIRVGSDDLE